MLSEEGDTKPVLHPAGRKARSKTYAADEPIGMEVSGNSALYKGDFKITRHIAPVGDNQWRLYNIKTDPGETSDLSATSPDKKSELIADYQAYAARIGVLEMPAGYDSRAQIEANIIAKQLKRYRWMIALMCVVLIGFLYGIWRILRRLVFARNNT